MKQRFAGTPLASLEGEPGLHDDRMCRALIAEMQPGEGPIAQYSVSAHIWVEAVLTDRALLLVKGGVRTEVIRELFPLPVAREPQGTKRGVRLRTSLGTKTLWGSALDPDSDQLLTRARGTVVDGSTVPNPAAPDAVEKLEEHSGLSAAVPRTSEEPALRPTRKERREARRTAGRKPRKPKLKKASRPWVGLPPSSTIWEMSPRCVKCGRPLTNLNSQRHRVGTDCIKRYGSQARKIPNPAYTAWSARRAKADTDRIAQQAVYQAEHSRTLAEYTVALDRWQRIRAGQSKRPHA